MLKSFTNGSQSQGYSEWVVHCNTKRTFYMPNARCLALIYPNVFFAIFVLLEVLSVHFVADG